MVWTEPGVRADFPYLALDIASGLQERLKAVQTSDNPKELQKATFPIRPDTIVRFEEDHPELADEPLVQTAARLNVNTGDWVRVESQVSALEAPAYVHPAAVPGVASMAIGDGHAHYGRYASGRGANPISILASVWEPSTGRLALGATRVRITRIDRKTGGLIQFSPRDREQGPWGYR
jgi:hypothetical protein